MKDQPCETEPNAPNEEVDDTVHNDEAAHINIHNMRWENIKTHFLKFKTIEFPVPRHLRVEPQ